MVVTLSQACCTCPQGLEGWQGLMVPQLAHLEAGSTSLGFLGPRPGAVPRASGLTPGRRPSALVPGPDLRLEAGGFQTLQGQAESLGGGKGEVHRIQRWEVVGQG